MKHVGSQVSMIASLSKQKFTYLTDKEAVKKGYDLYLWGKSGCKVNTIFSEYICNPHFILNTTF